MPEVINVNNSSIELSILSNKRGILTLYAYNDDNEFLDITRWHLYGTAQLVRAYWLLREWVRVSEWTRALPEYKFYRMGWPQYGDPLIH